MAAHSVYSYGKKGKLDILISHANDTEQLLFIDIDLSEVAAARSALPVEKDRKDALYHTILNEK